MEIKLDVGRLFLGALSLDPGGWPRLDFGVANEAGCLVIEIRVGVLAASTCDFVTCAASLKASGSLSIIWCRCSILFTSSLARLVGGSCQNGFVVCHFNSAASCLVPVFAVFSVEKVSSWN